MKILFTIAALFTATTAMADLNIPGQNVKKLSQKDAADLYAALDAKLESAVEGDTRVSHVKVFATDSKDFSVTCYKHKTRHRYPYSCVIVTQEK